MEADSARGYLENSASDSLAIAKTAVVAVSASTSCRSAGAKTEVTNGLSQSRAHESTCMGCQCHGGEQHQRQPHEQRSGGGGRAVVAAASASRAVRKDSLRTGIGVERLMTIQYTSTHVHVHGLPMPWRTKVPAAVS